MAKKEWFKIIYDKDTKDIILRVGEDFGYQFCPFCSKEFLEVLLEEITPKGEEFDFITAEIEPIRKIIKGVIEEMVKRYG